MDDLIAAQRTNATSDVRRQSQNRSANLTEDQIVSAALAIIRTEGLDALSMRRLSRELGRSAMAPYWYVSDKRELLELVAKKLLSQVQIPATDSGPWDERLRTVINSIDARLHEHPGVAAVLLEKMTYTDRRLMNGILDILLSAGLQGPDVFLAYAMVHTYLFGRYQVQSHSQDEFASPNEPAEFDDQITALMPSLRTLRGRDFFNYGVDTIIAGLKWRLSQHDSNNP